MKKNLLLFFCLLVPLFTWAGAVDTLEIDNFRYELNPDEGTATVLGVVDPSKLPEELVMDDSLSLAVPSESGAKKLVFKVTALGDYCFEDCSGLTSIVLPSYVKTLGYACFYECKNLKTVQLNEGLEVLGPLCFEDCWQLEVLELPLSITELGSACFEGCSFLSYIICRAVTPPTVGDYVFDEKKSVVLKVPLNLVEAYSADKKWGTLQIEGIPYRVFESELYYDVYDDHAVVASKQDTLLWYAIIKDSVSFEGKMYPVTELGFLCFGGCKLYDVVIPKTVTTFGQSCFYNSGLKRIYIPGNVTKFDRYCFANCQDLELITCESVTPPALGKYAFRGLDDKLSDIVLRVPAEAGTAYRAADQWKDLSVKTAAWNDGVVYELVDGVAHVAPYQNPNLKGDVKLASEVDFKGETYAVTALDDYSFNQCIYITSVDIAEGVTSLGDEAFAYCMALEKVTIPEGVTTLGAKCFASCSDLPTIELPSTVDSIGKYCFSDCDVLRQVTCLNPTPPVCADDYIL